MRSRKIAYPSSSDGVLKEVSEMSLSVQIETPKRTLRCVHFDKDVLSVGRDGQCDVILSGKDISRIHFEITLERDGLRLRDRSTNGTLADGSLVQGSEARVPLGAPIRLGGFLLVVQARRDVVADPVEASSSGGTYPAAPKSAADLEVASAGKGPALKTCQVAREARAQGIQLRREIHAQLLSEMDLSGMDLSKFEDPSLRPKVIHALRRIVEAYSDRLPKRHTPEQLVAELAAEALGLGPLEDFLDDPEVTEIMVVDPDTIYVERNGRIELTSSRFTDDERARAAIERIVTPLGRRIDESSPVVDARLPDGSRVNAVIKPLALRGACITIRKFAKEPLTMDDLLGFTAISPAMARFLTRSVIAKKNIVISGGTGSGKTTLLNVLSAAIPAEERVVTIEDAAELQLAQPHVVALETRPANLEGKGAYTIRELLKNAMRMRPDRIIVGECRGGEALDMLQAMNTGHDGSLTTTHANSPSEAVSRLETLVLTSGVDLPIAAVRHQIASSVDLVVQQSRFSDGSRRVTSVGELAFVDGEVEVVPIFEFVRLGTETNGEVRGEYRATGYVPSYLNELIVKGLVSEEDGYL